MDFTEIIVTALSLLFTFVIGPLVAVWLKKKIDNERIEGVALALNDAVATAVPAVAQTYLKAIREGKKDGHLSDEEKRTARDMAVAHAKTLMGPVWDSMKKAYADPEGMLALKVEAEVSALNAALPGNP